VSPGYAITGGQDGIVNVFILGDPSTDPAYSLLGHSANVCALATSPTGAIVSGSWDSFVSLSIYKFTP
jgi:phospholipase A-2-activating protein